MVRKVIMSDDDSNDDNDFDGSDAPEMVTKEQAAKQFKEQKINIK